MSAELRVERIVYGGRGLVRGDANRRGVSFIPYALPGELVEAAPRGTDDELTLLRVIEPSSERVQPECPHFGVCGGCHLQMASYSEQLRIKADVLRESLSRAGVTSVPEIKMHAGGPWHYRNRIRLHVTREHDALRLGYRMHASAAVLPIDTCPIAAPLLWRGAEALVRAAARHSAIQRWMAATAEVELFCDADQRALQITLLLRSDPQFLAAGFEQAFEALRAEIPELAGAGATLVHPRTGQPQRELAAWGARGLSYDVEGERYWVSRGGFFQVNRFLLPEMVELVCAGRSGSVAWDLFAGVGLFARVLARSFASVTAVEANPVAARELEAALRRIGPNHRAVSEVIANFLRSAVLDRERPDLVVLDPPRAGVGVEACELLARLRPPQIIYVSCDPVTLARDLAVLQTSGYSIKQLHLVDLFPQTYHQEAVVELSRPS